MKVTPLVKGATSDRRQTTFNTQRSPSMREKLAAAAKAPPPPSGVAEGGAPPAGGAHATPPAQAQSTQIDNIEGKSPGAEAKTPETNPQLAALARKERQLRKAQAALQAEKSQWEKERDAAFIPKARLTENPRGVLSELGITYDKLTEQELGDEAQDPQAVLLKKIADLEAKLDAQANETKTSQQQRDIQARENAVNQVRADAKLLVDSDPAFETIKATDSVDAVVELIEKTFDDSGEMLSVEEAAKLVEETLVEKEAERIRKLSNLQKIKSKLAPTEGDLGDPKQGTQKPLMKTLTNSHAATRPLSARERAIQAFERARMK